MEDWGTGFALKDTRLSWAQVAMSTEALYPLRGCQMLVSRPPGADAHGTLLRRFPHLGCRSDTGRKPLRNQVFKIHPRLQAVVMELELHCCDPLLRAAQPP